MSKAPYSFAVGTTLTAYRIVRLTSGNTVAYCTATSDIPIGVTQDDVKETTQAIPVASPGDLCLVEFGNSCAAGALCCTDSSGRAIPWVDVTAGGYVIGVLTGNKVEKSGTLGRVAFNPFWKIIT